ncbi:MAG: PqqD family protein [Chloroflexota bacterium]
MQKPKQKPDFRLEMMDGEMLLYHPAQTNIFYCNQTASLIWQLCSGEHTAKDMEKLLGDAFPEAADTIRADIDETLKQFAEHGAIEFV